MVKQQSHDFFTATSPRPHAKTVQLCTSQTAICICIHGVMRTFHSNHPKGHIPSLEILLNSLEFHQFMYF